jgi:hypothetical protein
MSRDVSSGVIGLVTTQDAKPTAPQCGRCGGRNVRLLSDKTDTLLRSCATCGEIWGTQQTPLETKNEGKMSRRDCLEYLSLERRYLAELLCELHREFEALRRARFPREQVPVYCGKFRAFRGLHTNHCIALKWTLQPPNQRMLTDDPSASPV